MKTPARILLAILLLSAFLRIYGITSESFWLDEGFAARRAQSPAIEILNEMKHQTVTGTYFLLLRGWVLSFGASVFSMRFPSALLGVLAVAAVFLLARELFSEKAALWAAGVMAVNPFAIHYAQEATTYALYLCAATTSTFLFVRLLRSYSKWNAWAYLFVAALACYTHPLVPLTIFLHALLLLILRFTNEFPQARRNFFAFARLFVGVFILYLPLLWFMWNTIAKKASGQGTPASWIQRPELLTLATTLREYFMLPLLAIIVPLFLWTAFLFLRNRESRERIGLIIPAMMIFVYMIVPFCLSLLLTPLYVHRYTIAAVPAFALGLGWGFSSLKGSLRWIAVAVFFGLTGFALYHYYTGSDKDPWRETAAFLQREAKPGDAIVMSSPWIGDPFRYYYKPIAGILYSAPYTALSLPKSVDSAATVFYVSAYPNSDLGRSEAIEQRLAEGRKILRMDVMQPFTEKNPYLYWMVPITVTRFVPRKSEQL